MEKETKIGRPTTIEPKEVLKAFNKYIEEHEQPIIKEFCINHPISTTRFYELSDGNKDLKVSIKKALDKQEVYMIKNASLGKINPVFTMFRLKQKAFGYKDKQEIDQTVTTRTLKDTLNSLETE